jgi:predicted YcjX-like family ATPase
MARPTDLRDSVLSGIRSIGKGASSAIDAAVNDDVIRVAVTGLSRAGKTVFITSLVQNLLALGQRRNTLPELLNRLGGDAGNRLVGVHLDPSGTSTIPRFEQQAKLGELAAETPTWPPRTEDLAQISVTLEIKRETAAGQRLGNRRIRIEILDYPGEWLLDLPLLDQSFAAWSADTVRALREAPRYPSSAQFLEFISTLDPDDPADDATIRRGHTIYKALLETLRTKHGLRYLQPARFICPGPRSDAPFLWFFPLDRLNGGTRVGSVGALLKDRFETYKQDMRDSFFDTAFSSFNRQIVLVDVLGAIYSGRAAFDDTVRAIHELASALQYGPNSTVRSVGAGLLRIPGSVLPGVLGRGTRSAARKLSNGRIERVAFVATKADHDPKMKRDNLRNLVRAIAQEAGAISAEAGATATYHAAAAIHSTADGTTKLDDQPVEVVKGIKLGEDIVRSFYVGEVPSSLPPDTFWKERYFSLPTFRPPRLDTSGASGIPHLHLDQVLTALIGDLL